MSSKYIRLEVLSPMRDPAAPQPNGRHAAAAAGSEESGGLQLHPMRPSRTECPTSLSETVRVPSLSSLTVITEGLQHGKVHASWWSRNKQVLKVTVLTAITLAATAVVMLSPSGGHDFHLISVSSESPKLARLNPELNCDYIHVTIRGALDHEVTVNQSRLWQQQLHGMRVSFCTMTPDHIGERHTKDKIEKDCVPLIDENVVYFEAKKETAEHDADEIEEFEYRFGVNKPQWDQEHVPFILVQSNINQSVALELSLLDAGRYGHIEEYVALAILLFLYAMIVTEMVHRAVASLVSALVSIAALTVLKEGPSLEKLVHWIDWETLLLLFGMMIMVAIFAESGFFDYCAVMCCKLARGNKWGLIFVLCITSAVVSAFLDNVTTVLLMTPVTIKICEALNFNPVPILIAIVTMSNVGGAATAIGDPPNVLIVSNPAMIARGVDFLEFTKHVCLGAAFSFVAGFATLYVLYRKKDFSNILDPEIQRLMQTIRMWTRYGDRIPSVSREETHIKIMIRKQITQLEEKLEEKMASVRDSKLNWEEEVEKLEAQSRIRNGMLLIKASLTLGGVVALFFLQSMPWVYPHLGMIALCGAIVLVVLSDEADVEHIFEKVEWTTLVFFGSLFVLMEALTELHLLDFIGDKTVTLISLFDEGIRLPLAITLVLWVSALSSSFIDNIPFTQAMIPIVIKLGESDDTLPMMPLVWALALGACLGGNGTLIGASANLVCAASAQQKGYIITFNQFFRTGFPIMIATTVAATLYLWAFYVWPLQWY